MLFLDAKLNIRFFTPAAGALFGVTPGDAGSMLIHKLSGRGSGPALFADDDELLIDVRTVLRTHTSIEREIKAQGGGCYTSRIMPYCTQAGEFEGVVITFTDISELRREIDTLKAAEWYAEQETGTLRSIFDSMAEAVIGADKDGNIVAFNQAAARLHGADPAPERVDNWAVGSGVYGPDGATPLPSELNPLVRALRGENTDDTVLYIQRADGSGSHMSVTGRPIRAADGSLLGGVAVLTDAATRSQVEERLRSTELYARSLIEASIEPLMTIGKDGEITDVNMAAELLTGLPRQRLVDLHISDCFTEPDKALGAFREVLVKGSVTDYALSIRHVSGKITQVLFSAHPYCNDRGDAIGAVATVRDITKHNQTKDDEVEFRAMPRRVRA